MLFCVIRLIALQAGSHECTDFSSRIVSYLLPHILCDPFFLDFPKISRRGKGENKKPNRLPQKTILNSARPLLSLVTRRMRVTYTEIALNKARPISHSLANWFAFVVCKSTDSWHTTRCDFSNFFVPRSDAKVFIFLMIYIMHGLSILVSEQVVWGMPE